MSHVNLCMHIQIMYMCPCMQHASKNRWYLMRAMVGTCHISLQPGLDVRAEHIHRDWDTHPLWKVHKEECSAADRDGRVAARASAWPHPGTMSTALGCRASLQRFTPDPSGLWNMRAAMSERLMTDS